MRSTIFENVSPPTKYFDGIGDDVLQQLGQMFVYKTISKALLLDHIPHVAWEREVASEHAFLTGIALDMLSLPLSKTEIYESKLSSINKEHGATKLSKLGAVLFKEAIPEKMCEELSEFMQHQLWERRRKTLVISWRQNCAKIYHAIKQNHHAY